MIHWQAEIAPVGHFTVLRALPTRKVQAVGPFVFLDHFGPAKASPETLPAHPHAGIEVMTYLIEGTNEHRDSFGHRGVVQTGGAQWMRAGRGILHAETHLPELAPTIHGLQIWARLPISLQDCEPQYRAISADEVPAWEEDGVRLRLLSGNYGGNVGPISLATASIMLHVSIPSGKSWSLGNVPADFEIAVYGISGLAALSDAELKRGSIAVPERHEFSATNNDRESAEVMILGGVAADRPLFFGGPFVLDSQAALQRANENYHSGKMGTLDGVPY